MFHKHCFHVIIDALFDGTIVKSQEKLETMLMKTFGGNTKSIMVFLILVN